MSAPNRAAVIPQFVSRSPRQLHGRPVARLHAMEPLLGLPPADFRELLRLVATDHDREPGDLGTTTAHP